MKHLNLILVAFSISLLFSCYPYDSVYTDELDLTLTLYDQETNFTNYNTFWIRDSVGLISNYLTDAQIDKFYETGGTSDKLRDAIKKKFIDEGYTEAADIESSDFFINNLVMKVESITYYPGWWYGYPGYWPYYPYWKNSSYYYYPGYPGYYPPYGGGYTYSTYYGTVYTEMIDTKSLIASDVDNPIDILWQVFVNGIISDELTYDVSRLQRGYNEAFEQSPYLK